MYLSMDTYEFCHQLQLKFEFVLKLIIKQSHDKLIINYFLIELVGYESTQTIAPP